VGTQELIFLIESLQQVMKQQRQDLEGGEKRDKMLLSMSKIVFEVIALGLEGVISLNSYFLK
jgi:hypothetical protein